MPSYIEIYRNWDKKPNDNKMDAVDITAECAKRLDAIKIIRKISLFDKSKLGL